MLYRRRWTERQERHRPPKKPMRYHDFPEPRVAELTGYRAGDVPGLVDAWNACFAAGPNFVRVGEADLRWRVLDQPAFDPRGIIAARSGERLLGFVHFGSRLDFWDEMAARPTDAEEGHIYLLVAPESDPVSCGLPAELLAAAEEQLVRRWGTLRRVLLGPSWVYGAQPFYNGIAGAYEMPGLGVTRESVIAAAAERGYRPLAEYGTPELDLSGPEPLAHMRDTALRLREQAQRWGLECCLRPIEVCYFPKRVCVELVRGREVVATTAFGLWPECARQYDRRLYGLTNVQVAQKWRGRGLGKLVMIEAMEAAMADGAEAVHLHVWRGNAPAWNLYHRALGFQPKCSWITLEKKLV